MQCKICVGIVNLVCACVCMGGGYMCDLKFTSYSNATIHLFQTHNIKCVRCGEICEGLCIEEIIKELDKAHYNEKEDMMQKIEKRIIEEEVQYIKHFEGVSERHMEKLKDIV